MQSYNLDRDFNNTDQKHIFKNILLCQAQSRRQFKLSLDIKKFLTSHVATKKHIKI